MRAYNTRDLRVLQLKEKDLKELKRGKKVYKTNANEVFLITMVNAHAMKEISKLKARIKELEKGENK